MPLIQCPSGCLFQIPETTFEEWKPKLTQVSCPKCRRIFPRNRFSRPGGTGEGITRMPAPNQPLTRLEHAQRVVRLTAPVSKSMGELTIQDGKTMKELVNEKLQVLTKSQAPDLVTRVCTQLIQSSLTANFPTIIIFELLVGPTLKNFWQIPREEGYDVQKYGRDRELTELSLHPVKLMHPSKFELEGKPGLPSSEYGTSDDRPISAALNIGYFFGGAAPMYGTSYLVLRDNVKQRCTFTAGDSLEHHWKRKMFLSTVGTSDNLVNVLYGMTDSALSCVAGLALNVFAPKQGQYLQYVEAQIFGGIDIRTDVRAIVIDEDELTYWLDAKDQIPEHFKGHPREIREELITRMRKMMERFCKENRITLEYIRSGKCDGLLFSNQIVYQPVRFRWQK